MVLTLRHSGYNVGALPTYLSVASNVLIFMFSKLKTIAISAENYQELKSLGKAGDSFNDVITQILKNKLILRKLSGKVTQDQF